MKNGATIFTLFSHLCSLILGIAIYNETHDLSKSIIAGIICSAILVILEMNSRLYKILAAFFGIVMGGFVASTVLSLLVSYKFNYVTSIHNMEDINIILIVGVFFFFITYFYSIAVVNIKYQNQLKDGKSMLEISCAKELKKYRKEEAKKKAKELATKEAEEKAQKEAEARIEEIKKNSQNGTGGYFNI